LPKTKTAIDQIGYNPGCFRLYLSSCSHCNNIFIVKNS
jgi:hypothetical protein